LIKDFFFTNESANPYFAGLAGLYHFKSRLVPFRNRNNSFDSSIDVKYE